MRFRLRSIAAVIFILWGALVVVAQDAPLRRPAPAAMSGLKTLKAAGVSVVEVSDYVYGNYRGGFESPPKEHSDKATGGWGWRSLSWDHWPVGWLNSQAHDVDDESYKLYPSHFAPFGLDLWSMKNEETERRDFYSLMGVAGKDVEPVRRLAREWLTRGATDPARVAALRPARR